MIVVCTHNGCQQLKQLISGFEKYGTENNKVVIVDTKSDDKESLKYLKKLENYSGDFEIKVEYLENNWYEVGAFAHAYRQYSDDYYLFMHDSIVLKKEGWFSSISKLLTDDIDVVALASFPFYFSNRKQIEWFARQFKQKWNNPQLGIAGCQFYTSEKTLDYLSSKGWLNFNPSCKNEGCAMERGLAIVFQEANLNVTYMSDTKFLNTPYMEKYVAEGEKKMVLSI